MNILQQFADQHNIQFQNGLSEGDESIPGARGEIYFRGENDEQLLAVHITKNWNHAKSILRQADCEVVQNGDLEGVVTFDHNNTVQVQKALQFARCYPKAIINHVKIPFRPIRNAPIAPEYATAAQGMKISLPLRPVKA